MGIYYVSGVPFGDELYHHGITGQKWGIRRYQNLDGTLTAAGRERYGHDVSSISENKIRRQNNRIQYKREHGIKEFGASKQFIGDINKISTEHSVPREEAIKLGEKYIRNIAKLRLESMGYEATKNNIETLSGKKWFRNSTLMTNTLATIGLTDLEYTSRDDIRVGKRFSIS